MAAGTGCKLRLYQKSDSANAYHRIFSLNKVQKLLTTPKYTREPCLFELQHTKAASNGPTEISAPNAVFNATSIQYIKWGIESSSADDTDNAAKDVRAVKVLKLMSNDTYVVETLRTAGATHVLTTETSALYAKRILHMWSSEWGSAGSDAKGNIVLGSCAFQEGGMTGKTSATASGLAASTKYYYKYNIDGAGVVERDITTSTDVTLGAVITLLNAEATTHSDAVYWEIVNGDVRLRTTTCGSASSIEMSAGSSGTDMFATLTNWAEEATVAGADYLTITANYNESDGSAIFVPDGSFACIDRVVLNQTTLANAGSTYVQILPTNMGDGADPDMDAITVLTDSKQTKEYTDDRLWESDGSGKLTFKESYITGQETLSAYIAIIVYAEVAL